MNKHTGSRLELKLDQLIKEFESNNQSRSLQAVLWFLKKRRSTVVSAILDAERTQFDSDNESSKSNPSTSSDVLLWLPGLTQSTAAEEGEEGLAPLFSRSETELPPSTQPMLLSQNEYNNDSPPDTTPKSTTTTAASPPPKCLHESPQFKAKKALLKNAWRGGGSCSARGHRDRSTTTPAASDASCEAPVASPFWYIYRNNDARHGLRDRSCSGDAHEHGAQFRRRQLFVHYNYRRRKSCVDSFWKGNPVQRDDEDFVFDTASSTTASSTQGSLPPSVSGLLRTPDPLRAPLRHQNTIPKSAFAAKGGPLLYRRCRSAVTIDDMIGSSSGGSTSAAGASGGASRRSNRSSIIGGETPGSGRGGSPYTRKLSVGSFLMNHMSISEAWPESVTDLLTGRQLLPDRMLLLSRLAEILKTNAANSQNTFTSEEDEEESSYKQTTAARATRTRKLSDLRLLGSGVSIARPDKSWGGEDAFFVADSTDVPFFGVADGVGEWGELGCNPRQFAEELMTGAKLEAQSICRRESKTVGCRGGVGSPQRGCHCRSSSCNGGGLLDCEIPTSLVPSSSSLLKKASQRAKRVLAAGFESARSFGSSTALVVGLNQDGSHLGIANLGDSTCLVLRRETKNFRHLTVYHRTREQQHFFNCPFQLSRVPTPNDFSHLAKQGMQGLVRTLSSLTCHPESDTPEMADLYDFKIAEGDLLVLGTDGVFDNLFDQEIANLASLAISPFEAEVLKEVELNFIEEKHFLQHPNAILPPHNDERFGCATPPENIALAITAAAYCRSLDSRARTPFARHCRRAGGFFCGGKMDDITTVAIWVI